MLKIDSCEILIKLSKKSQKNDEKWSKIVKIDGRIHMGFSQKTLFLGVLGDISDHIAYLNF